MTEIGIEELVDCSNSAPGKNNLAADMRQPLVQIDKKLYFTLTRRKSARPPSEGNARYFPPSQKRNASPNPVPTAIRARVAFGCSTPGFTTAQVEAASQLRQIQSPGEIVGVKSALNDRTGRAETGAINPFANDPGHALRGLPPEVLNQIFKPGTVPKNGSGPILYQPGSPTRKILAPMSRVANELNELGKLTRM